MLNEHYSPIYKLIYHSDLFDMIVKNYFTDKMISNMNKVSKEVNKLMNEIEYKFKLIYDINKIYKSKYFPKIRKISCDSLYTHDIDSMCEFDYLKNANIEYLKLIGYKNIDLEKIPYIIEKLNIITCSIKLCKNINYKNIKYLRVNRISCLLSAFKDIVSLCIMYGDMAMDNIDLNIYEKLKILLIESYIVENIKFSKVLENLVIDLDQELRHFEFLFKHSNNCQIRVNHIHLEHLNIKKLILIINKSICESKNFRTILRDKLQLTLMKTWSDSHEITLVYYLPEKIEFLEIVVIDRKICKLEEIFFNKYFISEIECYCINKINMKKLDTIIF